MTKYPFIQIDPVGSKFRARIVRRAPGSSGIYLNPALRGEHTEKLVDLVRVPGLFDSEGAAFEAAKVGIHALIDNGFIV